MPKKLVLVPVSMKSRSSKLLAQLLSTKVGHKVFRVTPDRIRRRLAVTLQPGTDKLTQLTKFKEGGVNCPLFTTNREEAVNWLEKGAVVCRTLLRSSEGKGIVIAEKPEELVPAPLYTQYVKKKKEFRVHIYDGEVVDVQEKRKRREHNDPRDTRVRNLANGYVFCREDVWEPEELRELARKAVNILTYKLGAVDIIYNEKNDSCYVLEVNATPGMEGQTLEKYANAINKWYQEQNNAV